MCVTLGQNKEMSRPDLDNATWLENVTDIVRKEKVAHEFPGMSAIREGGGRRKMLLSGKQKFDKIWGLTWIEPVLEEEFLAGGICGIFPLSTKYFWRRTI